MDHILKRNIQGPKKPSKSDQDEMFKAKKQKNKKSGIPNSVFSQNRKMPISCTNKQNNVFSMQDFGGNLPLKSKLNLDDTKTLFT